MPRRAAGSFPAWAPAATSVRSGSRARSGSPRPPRRSGPRTAPTARFARPVRTALRRSSGRWSPISPAAVQGGEVVAHDLAVGVAAQSLADQFGRRRERQVHRLPAEVRHGTVALRADLAPGAREQLVLLLLGLLHRHRPLLARELARLEDDRVRLRLGVAHELPVLGQELGSL